MRIGRRRLVTLLTLLAVLTTGTAAGGPKDGAVSPALRALHDEYVAHGAASRSVFTSRDRMLRVVKDRVVIDAAADGDPRALEQALVGLGMRRPVVSGRIVSGQLPIAAIPALAAIPGLRLARPSYAARRAGSVTSQGDHAMGADAARATYGVTGAGVKVGVLSDSFNCLGGATGGVNTGDLSPVTVIEEILDCDEATDEGRALLEIVHDVAPGASLSFASAFNGLASFAENILALRAAGAGVIVDDIFYFSEPMFQDGLIAQAVDTVVSQGAVFLSAAGNDARQSYESAFRPGPTFGDGSIPPAPGGPHFFGGVAHNFAPSGLDVMQRITIPAGETLTLVLQWDSPFFSVSGGAGSLNDLDIYLLNAAGTQVVAASATADIGGDAFEFIDFTNNGPTADFNIMILLFTGTAPGLLKYIHFNSAVTIREFATASATLFGHPNAAGARAVGAASFRNTPAFGVNPPLLAPYSSAGPTPILFDTSGHRLGTPSVRAKPEIMAPDAVSTTFFGVFTGGSSFPTFFGTSAAVAHAGGVAALMLETLPGLSPAALYATLESTAADIGPPGFDFDSGFGLIQADAALRAAVGPGLSLGLALNRRSASAGDPVQLALTVTNPGPAIVQDFYFVVLPPPATSAALGCPAGDAAVFATAGFAGSVVRCTANASPQSFPKLASGVIPAALPATALPTFFSLPWPGGVPPGNYTFAVFTTAPNALADGVIGPTDVAVSGLDQLQSLP
jgi:hypothetical protein